MLQPSILSPFRSLQLQQTLTHDDLLTTIYLRPVILGDLPAQTELSLRSSAGESST